MAHRQLPASEAIAGPRIKTCTFNFRGSDLLMAIFVDETKHSRWIIVTSFYPERCAQKRILK